MPDQTNNVSTAAADLAAYLDEVISFARNKPARLVGFARPAVDMFDSLITACVAEDKRTLAVHRARALYVAATAFAEDRAELVAEVTIQVRDVITREFKVQGI